jgi:CRISPR-associated protein Cmr2
LVKRFAAAAFFARELGLEGVEQPPQLDPAEHLAVLAMDGDDLGGWLRGEHSPPLREVLHPDLRDYFAALDGTAAGLAAPRPVGPALHVAISQAQSNFALHVAPRIVERHGGTLIYSGGRDVLALLPASTAVACAHELRLAYAGDPRVNGGARSGYYRPMGPVSDRAPTSDLLVMGACATISAGLAVAHGEENLRLALPAARKALAAANDAGRDIMQIVAWRRSGEPAATLCPWEFADTVQAWTEAFSAGACDRWLGGLRAELPMLTALGDDVLQAEFRRQIGRMEKPTRDEFPPDGVAAAFDAYRRNVSGTRRVPPVNGTRRVPDTLAVLDGFVSLLQMASFLARGNK